MHRRAMTESPPSPTEPTSHLQPSAVYSHVSTYRSSPIELQLYSPALRVDARGPLAVFNDNDQLSGKVMLDFQAHHTGRLVVTVEGCILYAYSGSPSHQEPRKHIFCKIANTINVTPPAPRTSRFAFREAFMRRPSASYPNAKAALAERSYPFQIALPKGCHPGQDLPHSFSSSVIEGNPLVSTCDISYKVVASWYPDTPLQDSSHLEVPIVLEGDKDFQCQDAANTTSPSGSWMEIPLKTERAIGLKCAIALPSSVAFSRLETSVPYFVVFSTTPRCPLVAREIAADATISVQLVKQIVVQQPQMTFPLTPPPSPSKESSPVRMLRRVARSNPRLKRKRSDITGQDTEFRDKPLPDIPLRTSFSETKTVHSNFVIGFSKRPRHACEPKSHPSLEEQSSLPDGLHKGKINLHKDMLPSIDCEGVSVKYYLDVSVLVGVDDLRARIPVRIF